LRAVRRRPTLSRVPFPRSMPDSVSSPPSLELPVAPAPYPVELARLDTLRSHPRNYRTHPEEQLEHIAASIRQHGFYRNVVVTEDGTILAGHGVTAAARKMGYLELPVIRLSIDPMSPAALRLLAGDNEIGRRAEIDDRGLSEILRDLKALDIHGLLGTGYDAAMLANLVFITRPESEIPDAGAAAAWAGMPDFAPEADAPSLVVRFDAAEKREEFLRLIGVAIIHKKQGAVWSVWWPERAKDRPRDVAFVEATADETGAAGGGTDL
jgi:hypothetical protein